MNTRKEIFDNFNKFINEQNAEPFEVCQFITQILIDNGYRGGTNSRCFGEEFVLED